MSAPRRSLLPRLLLVAFSLILAAALLELALRLTGGGSPARLEPMFDREVLDYLPEPHSKDPERWRRPRFRVAVIGDSFTRGDGVNWDDAYPQRLARLLNLNESSRPAEVHVWARDGYNTRDEVLQLEEAMQWNPHLVILGVFLNDSEDPRDPKMRELREELLPKLPPRWFRRIGGSSRAVVWLWDRIDAFRRRQATRRYSDLIWDPDYSGWRRFERALDRFERRTRRGRVPLVAVLFPQLENVGPFSDPTGHRQMLAELEERSIETLDLRPHFDDKLPLRMVVYPGVDGHPTEIAHRIAARALFDYLLDRGHLAEEFRPKRVIEHRSREEWLQRLRRYQDPFRYQAP